MPDTSPNNHSQVDSPSPPHRLVAMYQTLNASTLHMVETIYRTDVTFIDPAHRIQGLDAVKSYFAGLYENASNVSFHIYSIDEFDHSAWLSWEMTFVHPKMNQGKPINVNGCTHIKYDTKVYYHRDYYDMGELIYEHLPLLGRIVRWLKQRLNSPN